jgi:hypothetical protein
MENLKQTEFRQNTLVEVVSGYTGELVHTLKKTGETFVWPSYGDAQELKIEELKAIKATSKGFFARHWFIVRDPAAVEYLGLGAYYKNYVEGGALIKMAPEEIKEAVRKLTPPQKRTLAGRVCFLMRTGKIDSNKTIDALESALGVALRQNE